jgi:enoyl-CoA hydratase/carnithine racemase
MTEYVNFAVDDGVATITLNRPEKRNAMNWPMLHEFYAAVKRAGTEDGVGAVVITGSGGSFCAGTDLAALNDTPEDERSTRGAASDDAPPPFQIAACPRPVIAAVDGAAMGMGAEFVTQCDVRIASTNAKFGFVFVLRGLVSDTGAGSFLLPRIIGPTEALRLLLSGEVIDAQQALELGFVTRVVAPEDLAAAAEEEARRYLKASPFAVDRMKRLVYGGMHNDLHTHMVQTAKLLAECFHSEDHAEGVAAFLERRDANFTGR